MRKINPKLMGILRTRVKKIENRYYPQYTFFKHWKFFENTKVMHYERKTQILTNRISFEDKQTAREYTYSIKSKKDVIQILNSKF